MGRRVDEHGVGTPSFDIVIDGFALKVHNTQWPIHVHATIKNLKWLCSRLQNEILVFDKSPTFAASSPSVCSIARAGTDVEPQTSTVAIPPHLDDAAIAIGCDSLPTGITWLPSRQTFVVNGVGIAGVRCRVKRRRNETHEDHIEEIKVARRNAISFLERGCAADDDADDSEPDVHDDEQDV